MDKARIDRICRIIKEDEWNADLRQILVDIIDEEPEQLTLPTRAVPSKTLAEAVRESRENAAEGAPCPCCGRLVKLYRRKLHTEMAAFLCRLTRRFKEERRYYSTRELCPALTKASTDGSYLVLWDLIERQPSLNGAGATIGMYRPTEHGLDFVAGITTVRSHVEILCGDVIGFSEEFTTIREALGNKFDYDELMGVNDGNT